MAAEWRRISPGFREPLPRRRVLPPERPSMTSSSPSHPFDLAHLVRSEADGLAGAIQGVLGRGADLQEVLQEVFLKAWRALEAGQEPRDPRAWLFTICLNEARDRARRAGSRPAHRSLEDEPLETLPQGATRPHEDPAARLAGRETLDAARAAIETLDDPLKDVFLLRVSGDLAFPQVAEALGIPVATAKGRMRRALDQLRSALAPHHDLPGEAAHGGL